jgi:hypothetical protein
MKMEPIRGEPWKAEPNYVKWTDHATGYRCMITRVDFTGALCGYVRVPKGHPFYRRKYSGRIERLVQVHGGVTFSGRPTRWTGGKLRGHWFGFDCAHAWDFMPYMGLPYMGFLPGVARDSTYRDLSFVRPQVEAMAKQLKRVSK